MTNNGWYSKRDDKGILACFEKPGIILKSIVLVMIAAFCSQLYLPALQATEAHIPFIPTAPQATPFAKTPTITPQVKTVEDEFATTVAEVEATIAKLQSKLATGDDDTLEKDTLAKLETKIINLDAKVSTEFSRIGNDLYTQGLPAKILARHQAAVDKYRVELAKLLNNLRNIANASTPAEAKTHADAAKKHMESHHHKLGKN
ncbi:MAG: hypothetical protein R8L53_08955, partial [Mariprofundales bacterium]